MRLAAVVSVFVPENANAKKLGEGDAEDISTGKEIIQKSTYDEAQGILNDVFRGMMQEFSSHVTALHDPLFFSRRRFPSLDGSRSFSSWDPFSIAGAAQSVSRWSPRYEVVDNENSFALKVDVPGFHFHELNVELEAGGRVLSISGTKEEDVNEEWDDEEDEGVTDEAKETADQDKGSIKFTSHTSRSFQQKFTLDPTIDSSKMTANLDIENGTLVIHAPRKQLEIEYKKHIPITQVR
jgi:HSP20 family molecular chaperone IbpA